MSSLIVEVSRIEEIKPHPNADALEICVIKGWQCVVPKGKYASGDIVTYIPIDAVIPEEHSDRWGITKYLSKGRVRCAKLRGEPSFGVVIEWEDPTWTVGSDVAAHYGITRYEPPVRATAGDAETPHPLFITYTEIENLRNFPGVLLDGEPVSVTEKLHGTNCRVGLVEGELMAGSKGLRRKRPEGDPFENSTYWLPFSVPGVRELLEWLGQTSRVAILFGEVYGSKVQDLHYGEKGTLGFRAFDLYVDGKYLDYGVFLKYCNQFGVEAVPALYVGGYNLELIQGLAEGKSTLCPEHVREGVVVKPLIERTDPKVGRVALKFIGDGYLFRKNAEDSTDL